MKTVKMGSSTIDLPALALGIMRMGQQDQERATAALSAAVNAGITMIDSADIYDNGESEEKFGQALKDSQINRDHLFIQSKVGILPGKRYDSSVQHILAGVDGILKRMDIDYLDALLIHRPDVLMEPEEIAEAFDQLQASGKVRFFGVSNFNANEIELLKSVVDQPLMFDQLQFSLMHAGMLDTMIHINMNDEASVDHDGHLLPYLERKQVTLQCWSPFQYGNFAGTFINNSKFPKLNDELEKLAKKYQVGKNAIAVAWLLRIPAQVQVLIGSMTPAHIQDSASGANIDLTRQEWYDLYFAAGHDMP